MMAALSSLRLLLLTTVFICYWESSQATTVTTITSSDFGRDVAQMAMVDIDAVLMADGTHLDTAALAALMSSMRLGGGLVNLPSPKATGPISWDDAKNITSTSWQVSHILNLPPLIHAVEVSHGADQIKDATLFPHAIGIAATFDASVAFDVGTVTASELRSVGITAALGPNLDLATQPTWPGLYMTFGEDPYVAATLGSATIKGMHAPSYNLSIASSYTVASCPRSFVGSGETQAGQHHGAIQIPINVMLQYYVATYALVDGPETLMASITGSVLNGKTATASRAVSDMLRLALNFTHVVLSSRGTLSRMQSDGQGTVYTYLDAVATLHNTTFDMMHLTKEEVAQFADSVKIVGLNQDRVHNASARVQELKRSVGLHRTPTTIPTPAGCVFACEESRAKARRAATLSLTLLQNDGDILPIPRDPKSAGTVAIVGTACNSIVHMCGGHTFIPSGATSDKQFSYGSTVVKAFQDRGYNVTWGGGCANASKGCTSQELATAQTASSGAGIVLACIGEDPYAGSRGDIDDLTIDVGHIELIGAVSSINPNVVSVLVQGRPRSLEDIPIQSKAVLMAYLPGPFGGDAIADVVTGASMPSGRLPISYPLAPNSGPVPYWRKASDPYDVAWPFGHGLSYTEFTYGGLKAEVSSSAADIIEVSVLVTNNGTKFAADVTVLLFSSVAVRDITPEVKNLRGYKRTPVLAPGASTTVSFEVPITSFAMFNERGCMALSHGSVQFSAGTAVTSFTITHDKVWPCNHVSYEDNMTYSFARSPRSTAPRDVMLMTFVCYCAGLVVSSVVTTILRQPMAEKLD